MSIIAVMNRKGGSGKSTLATHIAAWCASTGGRVMLGNTDKQRSTQAWLGRRSLADATISSWPSDFGKTFRPVQGLTHVVDTPGGIHGLELAKLLACVDAIVMPVGPSIFDLETSVEFFRELCQHPRVASGRCKVAVVGMRWPGDTAQVWQSNGVPKPLPFLTVIPDDPVYRSCLETGSSVFDGADGESPDRLLHWQPLLDWLAHLLRDVGAEGTVPPTVERPLLHRARADHAARFIKGFMPSHPQLYSAESFVETRPPAEICAADLNMAGVPDSGHGMVQEAPSVKQAPASAAFKVIGHYPQYEVSLTTGLKTHSLNLKTPKGWLARFFKSR
ncbi:ParA family protein [Hydrogenophaga sp. BPS33]|uniref:ParA family protein n=1 Tax=Hydrogenophaga sp. BPS33 TaxID=2651974 RepID=UPI0013202C38|nr:ParA family protein [Hydrogenophaga sp. BPS33]QHE87182.1 ParA family protein [Hydrogenophaga sp. BPS33]